MKLFVSPWFGVLVGTGLLVDISVASEIYDPPVPEGRYILTPPAAVEPEIHGPSVFGVRPGSPFLYKIPATGEGKLRYAVSGLPEGLEVDAVTGQITGTIVSGEKREYPVRFTVTNDRGTDERDFRIVVGETIGLTPALGWNSWNAWGHLIDQEKVLATARAMVDKGLVDYGWTYINIDDCWQGERGGELNAIQPNENFPDMKALTEAIHALGMKAGIYSTPWVTSYAGFVGGSADNPEGTWVSPGAKGPERWKGFRFGEYSFEGQDARQWAEWGFDYLKYDWHPNDPEHIRSMAEALRASGRDINYSLSNQAPIEHAGMIQETANAWRTTGDLKDRWDEEGPNINLVQTWDAHRKWLDEGGRGGPGHFPDADMLVVGDVIELNDREQPRPSRLTPDEQYTHISLWSLWSSPMLIGCPVERMDEFTVRLLTNPEVLAVHQDETGIAGRTVRNADGIEVIVKDMADGSKAVGLFNRNDDAREITVDWETLGLEGSQTLRDVWRRQDIGVVEGTFTAKVQPHGVVMFRSRAGGEG